MNCDILIGLLSRAVQQRRKAYEEARERGKVLAPLGVFLLKARRSGSKGPSGTKLAIRFVVLLCAERF